METTRNEIAKLEKLFGRQSGGECRVLPKTQFIYTPNDNKNELIDIPVYSEYEGLFNNYCVTARIVFTNGLISRGFSTYDTFDIIPYAGKSDRITLSMLDEWIDKVHENIIKPNLSVFKEVFYSVEIEEEEFEDDGWHSFDYTYLYGYVRRPFLS